MTEQGGNELYRGPWKASEFKPVVLLLTLIYTQPGINMPLEEGGGRRVY